MVCHDDTQFCTVRESVNIFKSIIGNERTNPVNAATFVKQIGVFMDGRGQQQDPQEFLGKYLEGINQCECIAKKNNVWVSNLRLMNKCDVENIFGFYIKSIIQCSTKNCGHVSETFGFAKTLIVPVQESYEKIQLKQNCISKYFKQECIKYTCSKCKNVSNKHYKKSKLYSPPNVLILYLNRRVSETNLGRTRVYTIGTQVSFEETLDIAEHTELKGDNNNATYKLNAIIVNSAVHRLRRKANGSNNGHFFACVKTAPGVWIERNDEKTKIVDFRQVLEHNPCMLMYTRNRIANK